MEHEGNCVPAKRTAHAAIPARIRATNQKFRPKRPAAAESAQQTLWTALCAEQEPRLMTLLRAGVRIRLEVVAAGERF